MHLKQQITFHCANTEAHIKHKLKPENFDIL